MPRIKPLILFKAKYHIKYLIKQPISYLQHILIYIYNMLHIQILVIAYQHNHNLNYNQNRTLLKQPYRIPHAQCVKVVTYPPSHYVVTFNTTLIDDYMHNLFIPLIWGNNYHNRHTEKRGLIVASCATIHT